MHYGLSRSKTNPANSQSSNRHRDEPLQVGKVLRQGCVGPFEVAMGTCGKSERWPVIMIMSLERKSYSSTKSSVKLLG